MNYIKAYFYIILYVALFSELKMNEIADCNFLIGKWSFSKYVCSEYENIPTGSFIVFNKNLDGYIEYNQIYDKDEFTWVIKSDTLILNFKKDIGVREIFFESDTLLWRDLKFRTKQLEIRYLDRKCGLNLEFVD